jgi:hypothetical protein
VTQDHIKEGVRLGCHSTGCLQWFLYGCRKFLLYLIVFPLPLCVRYAWSCQQIEVDGCSPEDVLHTIIFLYGVYNLVHVL